MEGLAREKELCFQGGGPIGFDKFEVTIFVGTVDFVTDDWVSDVREMDADLMGSASFWFGLKQGERAITVGKPLNEPERGEGLGTVGMNGLLQIDFRGANNSLS